MKGIMTNIGIDKTLYRVNRTIVPIVPGEEKLGPNQLSANHLGRNTIEILLFPTLFYYGKN